MNNRKLKRLINKALNIIEVIAYATVLLATAYILVCAFILLGA